MSAPQRVMLNAGGSNVPLTTSTPTTAAPSAMASTHNTGTSTLSATVTPSYTPPPVTTHTVMHVQTPQAQPQQVRQPLNTGGTNSATVTPAPTTAAPQQHQQRAALASAGYSAPVAAPQPLPQQQFQPTVHTSPPAQISQSQPQLRQTLNTGGTSIATVTPPPITAAPQQQQQRAAAVSAGVSAPVASPLPTTTQMFQQLQPIVTPLFTPHPPQSQPVRQTLNTGGTNSATATPTPTTAGPQQQQQQAAFGPQLPPPVVPMVASAPVVVPSTPALTSQQLSSSIRTMVNAGSGPSPTVTPTPPTAAPQVQQQRAAAASAGYVAPVASAYVSPYSTTTRQVSPPHARQMVNSGGYGQTTFSSTPHTAAPHQQQAPLPMRRHDSPPRSYARQPEPRHVVDGDHHQVTYAPQPPTEAPSTWNRHYDDDYEVPPTFTTSTSSYGTSSTVRRSGPPLHGRVRTDTCCGCCKPFYVALAIILGAICFSVVVAPSATPLLAVVFLVTVVCKKRFFESRVRLVESY